METASCLREVVTVLSREIGVRSFRDPDLLSKTADYISSELTSSGYQVTHQSFPFYENLYDNVIAEIPGTTDPERILVVGAHYDTVATTPGADDNASGVAGLLWLARRLAIKQPAVTTRFVFFCLEEPPASRSRNMGSFHYAKSLKDTNTRIEGMICLEMIGYFSDQPGSQHYPFPFMNRVFPTTGDFIAMAGNVTSRRFTRRIAEEFRKSTDLPVVTLNAPMIVVGIDFSDHWSFNKLGYNALMVTDTAFYRTPHYHRPSDLPETLDYARMTNVVEGLCGAIRAWGT